MAQKSRNIGDRYAETPKAVDDFVSPGRPRLQIWEAPQLLARPELDIPVGQYDLYTVTDADIGRIDLLAWRFYRDVTWWWIIARYNGLCNPLTDLVSGAVLKIPRKQFVLEFLGG